MFGQALAQITDRLEQAKSRGLLSHYALVGGLAVSVWGFPRATQDIDFVLALRNASPLSFAGYLGAEYRPGDPDDPLVGVFKAAVKVDVRTVPVQLIILPARWTDFVFSNLENFIVLGHQIPVVSWQALILMKLYAGGPRDLLDAQEIFRARQPDEKERQAMAKTAEALDLQKEWQTMLGA